MEKHHDESSTIMYILPARVTELLKAEIGKTPGKVFLLFEHRSADCTIRLVRDYESMPSPWVSKTNRKAYINGKLYPVIFRLDQWFATPDDATEIMKRFQGGANPPHQIVGDLARGAYYVRFRLKGEILEAGYDDVEKN